MKKFLAFLMALTLVLSLGVTAFATDLYIEEPAGMSDATYAGYQLLFSQNDPNHTDRFVYSLNEKYAAILTNATGKTDEAEIIAYIAALDATGIRTFANNVYAAIAAAKPAIAPDASLKTGSNDVAEGYWLIAQTSAAGASETQSLVMIDTAGKNSVTIETKKDKFEIDKEVTDESQLTCGQKESATHQHTAACYDWTKTNESPIGATVMFKIETKVPANMKDYKNNAYFIVGDDLGQGLDLVQNSIVVTIGGEAAVEGEDYTVKFNQHNYDFEVALIDPKAAAGKDVLINYSAKVNEKAKLKLTGEPNTADITYSPTDDPKYGGDPDGDGFPTEEKYSVLGKGPNSYTITYGTGLRFQKVDEKDAALAGAEFTITGTTETSELKWVQDYVEAKAGETPTYYLLNSGKYTEQAPVTADYMKKVESTKYVGGYVVATGDDKVAVTVGGVNYRVATEADFAAGTDIYTLVKANADLYAELSPKYVYVEKWETQTATKAYNTVVAVDKNGIANLPGLAAGTYHIVESVVPEGYNAIPEFDVVITWTAPSADVLAQNGVNAQCTWTAKVGDKELSLTNVNSLWDLFGLKVVNHSGAELPSTGGIGTTIFYVLGSVMLLGAAVVLVTKKRMGAQG